MSTMTICRIYREQNLIYTTKACFYIWISLKGGYLRCNACRDGTHLLNKPVPNPPPPPNDWLVDCWQLYAVVRPCIVTTLPGFHKLIYWNRFRPIQFCRVSVWTNSPKSSLFSLQFVSFPLYEMRLPFPHRRSLQSDGCSRERTDQARKKQWSAGIVHLLVRHFLSRVSL